mmetsp:Transcript_10470/g.16042  ORF Transcript_10470/g.16042 Transcript_10470/m.16042 type:complete len:94 (-) Transcript_10470:1263-1544(-)
MPPPIRAEADLKAGISRSNYSSNQNSVSKNQITDKDYEDDKPMMSSLSPLNHTKNIGSAQALSSSRPQNKKSATRSRVKQINSQEYTPAKLIF